MRIRITIIAFMIILIDLWGSVNAGGIAEIEVGAGPNFGYLAYDDPLEIWDTGWAFGFTGEIGFEIPISDRLALIPSARFVSLSNKVEFDDPDIKGEYDINHKMISVPLLFRYDLKENMLFVETGPEISFFISSELNADYEELGIPRKETDDISDRVNNYNVGGCIKIGFKASRWNIPIAVTAAYHHGITGVAEEDKWLSDWKTREITLSVIYLLELSK